jgi:hypothetical protein
MFEKISLPKGSTPGVFITGESITNTKNSTFSKNSKSVLEAPTGTRRSYLMERKRRKIS